MKTIFAVPTVNGKSCQHFGHCEKFAVIEVEDNKIVSDGFIDPPPHEPGVFPGFLASQGVTIVIAGGMGSRAQNLFAQNNIKVVIGVGEDDPKALVEKYLNEELQSGDNLCSH